MLASYFASCVASGLGYCQFYNEDYDSFAADFDENGQVTLKELYAWAKNQNQTSLTRCYPENDDFVVASYDQNEHDGAILTNVKVSSHFIPAGQSTNVDISYETTEELSVKCEIAVSTEKIYLGIKYAADSIDLGHVLQGAKVTLPAGTYDSSKNRYCGSTTIPLDATSIDCSEIVYLRVYLDGKRGATYNIPINVLLNETADTYFSNQSNLALTLSDCVYGTNLSSTNKFTVKDGLFNELEIKAQFGGDGTGYTVPLQSGRYGYPTGVLLTCLIKDSTGNTVKTMANDLLAINIYNSNLSLADAINYFYWDGTKDNGDVVESGTYTVSLSGKYYKFDGTGALTYTTFNASDKTVTVDVIKTACNVTFYVDGAAVDTVVAIGGNLITETTNIDKNKTGLDFLGWFTKDGQDENNLGDWGKKWDYTSDKVKGDISLYARWGHERETNGIISSHLSNGELVIEFASDVECSLILSKKSSGREKECWDISVAGDDSYTNIVSLGEDIANLSDFDYCIYLVDSSFIPIQYALVTA